MRSLHDSTRSELDVTPALVGFETISRDWHKGESTHSAPSTWLWNQRRLQHDSVPLQILKYQPKESTKLAESNSHVTHVAHRDVTTRDSHKNRITINPSTPIKKIFVQHMRSIGVIIGLLLDVITGPTDRTSGHCNKFFDLVCPLFNTASLRIR